MAKYALVHNFMETRVQAVATTEAEKFDIHSDLSWIPCSDDVEQGWEYNKETGTFQPWQDPPTHYTVARRVGYGDVGAQLGEIFDAIQSGNANALTSWASRIEKIKILLPKDNEAAVIAVQNELNQRNQTMADKAEAGEIDFQDAPDVVTQLADEYINGTWICPVRGQYTGS